MPNISQEREAVMKAYSSESWKIKVKKMDGRQVFAVYMRLKNKGVIN